jgi:hypothetical protein
VVGWPGPALQLPSPAPPALPPLRLDARRCGTARCTAHGVSSAFGGHRVTKHAVLRRGAGLWPLASTERVVSWPWEDLQVVLGRQRKKWWRLPGAFASHGFLQAAHAQTSRHPPSISRRRQADRGSGRGPPTVCAASDRRSSQAAEEGEAFRRGKDDAVGDVQPACTIHPPRGSSVSRCWSKGLSPLRLRLRLSLSPSLLDAAPAWGPGGSSMRKQGPGHGARGGEGQPGGALEKRKVPCCPSVGCLSFCRWD